MVLTLWLRFYLPATDSFADLRDVPAILLAFFVGPVSALVTGTLAAASRAAIGLFGGIGTATWFGSSLATFVVTLVAVAMRRWVFLGETAEGGPSEGGGCRSLPGRTARQVRNQPCRHTRRHRRAVCSDCRSRHSDAV